MKKVIIIGGSSGIGEGMAYIYARKGYKVCIASRREDKLKEVADKFPENIIYERVDVSYLKRTDTSQPFGALDGFDMMINRLGEADLIIYCSGAGEQNTVLNIDKELNTCKVNIEGFMVVANKAVEYFASKGDTAIKPSFVVISSVAALRGMGISTSYSASKRFQLSYMEGLSQYVHRNKIRANLCSILPGFVATDFISNHKYPFIMSRDYASKQIVRVIDRGRFITIVDWKWQFLCFIWRLVPGFIWRRLSIFA